MQVTFRVETKPECIKYLMLEYQGEKYALNEFSAAFANEAFQLERLLPECKIVYRGNVLSFDDYKETRTKLGRQLDVFQKYSEEIFPIELHLSICNADYYKAAKFLEKAENCIQSARYYLMQGADIIEYDCNIPWKYGYQPIYDIRALNFTTAIIWYNNCFDYILQIAFLAFEIYKKAYRYKEDMTFEEKLSLCTFKVFRDLHKEYQNNDGVNQLWNILEKCHGSISDLNEWANYAKHKGGIGYIGLKPDSPYKVYVGNPDGTTESRTSEFESIKLDIDESISTLIDGHKALCKCLEEMCEFIDFEACKFTIDENGRFVIPEKSSYVKIQI